MDERETIGPRLSEARKIRVPSEKKKKKERFVSFVLRN